MTINEYRLVKIEHRRRTYEITVKNREIVHILQVEPSYWNITTRNPVYQTIKTIIRLTS